MLPDRERVRDSMNEMSAYVGSSFFFIRPSLHRVQRSVETSSSVHVLPIKECIGAFKLSRH